MDSLPIEIIETIFLFVNPKDYTNFILSYDVALLLWRSNIGKKYKEQYLRVVRENLKYSSKYVIKTIRTNNGENHGKYTSYYENGQLWMDTTYKNSQIHGNYTVYRENGKLWMNATYQNGQKHGRYTGYYKNGQPQVDTTYQIICDKSQIHGKYIQYYKNGQICEYTTY
jgi:antitoxin component YwqK of YwqJK toxin-antitoxin module